VEQKV